MKQLKLLTAFFILWAPAVMAGVIPADDENLQYTGRIDFSDKKAPVLSWPGTQIKTKFTGTSLKIKMEGDGRKNDKGQPVGPMYNVFIDGDFANPHVFGVKQEGEHLYTIAEGLENKTHDLLITARGGGRTPFLGLELDDGAKLEDPGERPNIKMEVFGDSISVGLGSDRKRGGEHSREATDNFQAYGAMVARNIGAEYHCTAKSGIGLIKSWWPTIMPQYYDRLCSSSLEGSGDAWDFRKWTADLVVINIFQNDSWTRKQTTTEEGVSAYVDFVKKIRGHYPEAMIVCVLGSMDASRGKFAGFVKDAVKQLSDAGDTKVHSYMFKTQTGHRHPNSKDHAKMAVELTKFLVALGYEPGADPARFEEVTEVASDFTPDPSRKYYIDCPATGLRLAGGGSKVSQHGYNVTTLKGVKTSTTGADVEWVFVANGDKWHIQLADGEEECRLWAANLPKARGLALADESKAGGWTQFKITGASNGKTFLTVPDGPDKFKRLFIGDDGSAGMVGANNKEAGCQLVVTEVRER